MKKQKFWLNIELILIIVLLAIPIFISQTNIIGFASFSLYPEEEKNIEPIQETEEVLVEDDVTNVEISENAPPPD